MFRLQSLARLARVAARASTLRRTVCSARPKQALSAASLRPASSVNWSVWMGGQRHGHGLRRFSSAKQEVIDVESTEELEVEEEEAKVQNTQQQSFRAETTKLLDIVAKSVYTDKEIFLRELLSNCSDACEKQRFQELTGDTDLNSAPLQIRITTNEKERELRIFDSGVGMTKAELINNLGTIAKSGTAEFVEKMASAGGQVSNDSIIGQFGIGFYSSFIVAESVEVLSKSEQEPIAHSWISDGSGSFTVGDVSNVNFARGTLIRLKLRSDCREFAREREIKKIVQKYSLFVPFPIQINGEHVNALPAIWYRSERQVTLDEYDNFYENLANTKVPFRYKLHRSFETPMMIKCLLYVPSTHTEKMGMTQEPCMLHLYSRKILIKQGAKELLPNYLRFVKGVVDCEDIPLNISRETYQDSSKIANLRNVLTKRVLRMLAEEQNRDMDKYTRWYQEFSHFLKQGIATDQDNKELLIKLMRYEGSWTDTTVSIDDYVQRMKGSQKKIYYIVVPPGQKRENNPFLEPFQSSDFPVLILNNHIDEICLSRMGKYKEKDLVNIETNFADLQNELGVGVKSDQGLPDRDISNFTLFLKHVLDTKVNRVAISRRLTKSPALVVGEISSSERHIYAMSKEVQGMPELESKNTLEINPNHSLITSLNQLRKKEPDLAKTIAEQIYDNALVASSIPFDSNAMVSRNQEITQKLMDLYNSLGDGAAATSDAKPMRSAKKPALKQAKEELGQDKQQEFTTVEIDQDGDPKIK